jgi:hypothetical protein
VPGIKYGLIASEDAGVLTHRLPSWRISMRSAKALISTGRPIAHACME